MQTQTVLGERFIPAGAGNTKNARKPTYRPAVHPRGCGEHHRRNSPVFVDYGSSPRVRGTLIVKRLDRLRLRFIPAGAGNTRLQ